MAQTTSGGEGEYLLICNFDVYVIREEIATGVAEQMNYKFMCFCGKVKCVFTVTERFSEYGLKVSLSDPDWNMLPFERHYPKSIRLIPKPCRLERMIELAESFSWASLLCEWTSMNPVEKSFSAR